MRELSLFTGIGGGSLGSMLLGWEPVQFVEYEPFCKTVLQLRFPDVPLHSDVRDFHPECGCCDVVSGGFPCQPFSQAGLRRGEDDPRNMWPHAVRVLVESGAPLGFFENVPGLLSSGYFGTVLGDLAEAGFDAEWCVLGADDVGAPHRRKRLWVLAVAHGYDAGMYAATVAGAARAAGGDAAFDLPSGCGEVPGGGPWWIDPADVGHTDDEGLQGHRGEHELSEAGGQGTAIGAGRSAEEDNWLAQPYVGRVADGIPQRVDRLKALGNAQVPQCMAAAFTLLAREAGILT